MPHHDWSDTDFDWKSLYYAEQELNRIMTRYGRIGVHSKEKYGCLRFSLYLCNGTLHSFTHPGYVYSQYPKWLWSFDIMNNPIKYIAPLIRVWQKLVIQYAFTVVCVKYPHIRDEIVMDAPRELLPCELSLASARLWKSGCNSCKEWSTSDNYTCPHCGKVKND
jgi:hypothetical protein